MNEFLKKRYSYLANFFEMALSENNKSVANSIIFYGMDVLSQYYMALSLAKQLNCTGDKTDDCSCVNCSWIRDNKHPAVTTVSKINNKTDSSKTVISSEQVEQVMDLLMNTSPYHRVFIFCDAEYKELSDEEKTHINEFKALNLSLPDSETEGMKWYPSGITKACFQDVAANSLLKSIEEPPENVTFIFLTADKEDLISTIISRSQSFFVPSFKKEKFETEFLLDWFADYPNFPVDNSLRFSKRMLEYQNSNGYKPQYILDCIEYYLVQIIKSNIDNKQLFSKIMNDIQKIQDSKKMLNSYVKDQTVFEDLAFYFAKSH
ncbi:MAG: hypothetical protein PHV37_08355 [Candidatus Gastranaerophilales bacterium]|nr:hypothetical protein [Candidatus Gastranaerophilales bacterium]